MDADEVRISQQRDPETYAIIGAAMEVHSRLGCGFLEAVYQQAFAKELVLQGIAFEREVLLPIYYRDELLECGYKVDFVCHGKVIVELKALQKHGPAEISQTLNYLKAGRFSKGLLINFGNPRLEYKRFIQS